MGMAGEGRSFKEFVKFLLLPLRCFLVMFVCVCVGTVPQHTLCSVGWQQMCRVQ